MNNTVTKIKNYVKSNKNLYLTCFAVGAAIGIVINERQLFTELAQVKAELAETTHVATMIWETYVAQVDLTDQLAPLLTP